MAIAEACQVWIEQRIEEELEQQEETGKSLREIGREISAEIEKYFEANVKPHTIDERARRMKAATIMAEEKAVQEEPTAQDEPIEEEESTPTDEGMVFDDTIPGYEEPVETVKRRAKKIKEDMMSPEFASAFDAFLIEIEAARTSSWKYTSKTAIMKCLSILYDAVV